MTDRYRCRIVLAEKIKDEDLFGKSDPYFTVECGDFRYRSREIKNTRVPMWDDTIEFEWRDKDPFKLVVFDRDFIVSDDYLGSICLGKITTPFSHGWHYLQGDSRIFLIFEKV